MKNYSTMERSGLSMKEKELIRLAADYMALSREGRERLQEQLKGLKTGQSIGDFLNAVANHMKEHRAA